MDISSSNEMDGRLGLHSLLRFFDPHPDVGPFGFPLDPVASVRSSEYFALRVHYGKNPWPEGNLPAG